MSLAREMLVHSTSRAMQICFTDLLQWLKYSALKSAGYRQGREAWHYTSTGEQ
jgi:hypothetical protein